MNKYILSLLTMLVIGFNARAEKLIHVSTDATDLVLQVAPNNRLYQLYLGKKLQNDGDYANLNWNIAYNGQATRGNEPYAASGSEDYFEPAVAITHADGNMTTYLYYKDSYQRTVEGGTETVITLQDSVYAVAVKLHYVAYAKENVIKAWSEITHHEKKPVTLWRYASTMLYLPHANHYLTSYHGSWGKEGLPQTELLTRGKKVIDTKLGTRAAMFNAPFFELGIGSPARENEGNVLTGTIGWTGNFSFTFEIDNYDILRIIPAINPYASDYKLKAGETFTTPEFIFTLSSHGSGEASRNLHEWARKYQLFMGTGDRMTLLNNWENTYFRFDQQKLYTLINEAKDLGVDLFLLDDGWFANKYPRKNDKAGLGDWEANREKLPDGIPGLVKSAKEAGVKFGIWVEPEMVNPKSQLFEQHPDWVIQQPQRTTYYYRNQLVLDISNPKVQDYVFGVIDRIMTENAEVAFFKWDCNSVITNIYSPYHKQEQGNFYIDHVRGIYKVLKRIHEKYPQLPMMLCSGGAGRMDYEALKYFTEFWCSDNTDPFDRLYIQWSLSKVFPVKALCAHVTNWNKKASIKFRTDVSSSCKLGFDINLSRPSKNEMQFMREAVKNFNTLKPVILDGDQYRLVSPYESNHCAINYVSKDKQKAVLFVYDLHPRYGEPMNAVTLQGLDPAKSYKVTETNLMPGTKSTLACNGKTYSGEYLMTVGLNVLSDKEGISHVLTLE